MTAQRIKDKADEKVVEIMAESDPTAALSDAFDAIIGAFGLEAVKRMSAEKLDDHDPSPGGPIMALDRVIKTCPDCGKDLSISILTCNPPITMYSCRCGFVHRKQERVTREVLKVEVS